MAPKPKALAWPSGQVHRPGTKKNEVSDAGVGGGGGGGGWGGGLASRGAGAP